MTTDLLTCLATIRDRRRAEGRMYGQAGVILFSILESVREIATSQPMLKTVVGLSEVGNYLRHLGSFLHRYAWASTSRSPSIGPFEASSLIFQELYLRTVSNSWRSFV